MIRVAVVIEALGRGGAERLLVDTARTIDRSRFELRVYTLFPARRDYAPTLQGLGVPERCLNLRGTGDIPRGLARLWEILRFQSADLIHTHLFSANVVGRLTARLRGRPVVSTIHDADYEPIVRIGNPGLTGWKHELLRRVDGLTARWSRAHLLCVSGYVAESARRRMGIPPERVEVLRNAVDTEVFRPRSREERRRIRDRLGLGEQPLMLCVGRLTPQKGQAALIEAFAELRKCGSSARLLLAGDGAWRETYERRARDLGLDAAVSFLGTRSDVPELLAASDLLALPSLHEGFGLVLVEALASGVPVVASRTGPIPEIVRDGETGILVEPGEPAALVRGIATLLDDDARRREMGRRGRQDVVERFALPQMIRGLEACYERLVLGRGPTGS